MMGNITTPQLPAPTENQYRLLIAAFSLGLYGILLVVFGVLQPDLDEHIVIAERIFVHGKVPAHPLFYFLIRLFSGFSLNFTWEVWASVFVFSGAQALKFHAIRLLLETIFSIRLSWAMLLGLLLIQVVISFSAFEPQFIVNQISPNFFHNGPMQVSLPFALLCFREAIVFSRAEEENPPFRKIVYWGLLCGLAKPSFLFCFIPFLPVYLFFEHGLSRKLLSGLQVSTLLTFLVLGQSFYLKLNPPNYVTSFIVLFLPFYQFGSLASHLKAVVYGGFCTWVGMPVFPGWWKSKIGLWALAMFGFSLCMAFTLVDEINGERFNNMTWQSSILLYILLVLSLGTVLAQTRSPIWKRGIYYGFLVANAAYGLVYFSKVVMMKTLFL